jgi:hypothetical protein
MSETVPQAATNLLDKCLEALREADLDQPIGKWLKDRGRLGEAARRQVTSILLFLDLLSEAGCLVSEVEQLQTGGTPLWEALLPRVRRAYMLAGCSEEHAGLIGNSNLTKEALGRVLEGERPFQRLENPDTRRNAIRFACHLHEKLNASGEKPTPKQETAKLSNAEPLSNRRKGATPPGSTLPTPPTRIDRGTIVNPNRYRIARVSDDLWVYGHVQFETPTVAVGSNWLGSPDVTEQARWLEQLAAALLQDADALRRNAFVVPASAGNATNTPPKRP